MEVIQAEEVKTRADTGYVCPYCGKKEHTPNDATRAAIEEGNAIFSGEKPAKWYHSLEEAIKDLNG
jgi:hypothetical protein